MSWDVFIQHLPASAARVADIPDDFQPLPLGSEDDVLQAIRTVFPTFRLTEPTGGVVEAPGYSIEIGFTVESVALFIRGDERVVPRIAQLVELLGARAVDSWTGEFFDPETAPESIRRWQQYVSEL
ncbi:MAG TPA: hypothetical protein VF111_16050 [Thermoanaerobaculia bacterium]